MIFSEDDVSIKSGSSSGKKQSVQFISRQQSSVNSTTNRQSNPIPKPPRAHRPNTFHASPMCQETNPYANTKSVRSHIEVRTNQLTTFQPLRGSASVGTHMMEDAKDSMRQATSMPSGGESYRKGNNSCDVLQLEADHVYVCVESYDVCYPGHLKLNEGDIVEGSHTLLVNELDHCME